MNIAIAFVLLSATVTFAQTPMSLQPYLTRLTLTNSQTVKAKQDKIGPLRIISKPTPQFTEEARNNGTTGLIRLRVTFLASGSIGDISPVNTLPDGLTESAIEAAKGIKFKPATKNDEPMTVTKLVEYSFATIQK